MKKEQDTIPSKRCGNCFFSELHVTYIPASTFNLGETAEPIKKEVFYCHRNPPYPSVGFPEVHEASWCGEWKEENQPDEDANRPLKAKIGRATNARRK